MRRSERVEALKRRQQRWNIWDGISNRYLRAVVTAFLLLAMFLTYYPVIIVSAAMKGAFMGAFDEISDSLRGGFNGQDLKIAWRALTLKDHTNA